MLLLGPSETVVGIKLDRLITPSAGAEISIDWLRLLTSSSINIPEISISTAGVFVSIANLSNIAPGVGKVLTFLSTLISKVCAFR